MFQKGGLDFSVCSKLSFLTLGTDKVAEGSPNMQVGGGVRVGKWVDYLS